MNPRFPSVLPLTIGPTPNFTCGKVDFMYGSTQLPSKMIAAFSLPSASPRQPTPSWVGVAARPLLDQPDVEVDGLGDRRRLHVRERALVLEDEREHRAQSAGRQIGLPPGTAFEDASFWAAAVSSAQVVGPS